jgi:membrane-bound serine protease (ClpP class)
MRRDSRHTNPRRPRALGRRWLGRLAWVLLAVWVIAQGASVLAQEESAAPQPTAEGSTAPGETVETGPPVVDVIQITSAITPITTDQIEGQIERSEAKRARALVLVMDTPGGLESSMRDIVKAILASDVPIITYVSPPGARAASAGLFIVTASHVAAMAPNTNLGAASPVSLGGPADTTLSKKATSDAAALIEGLAETRGRNIEWNIRAVREAISASATEALELNVVDLVATDLDELMEMAHGRTVILGERELILDLENVDLNQIKTSFRHMVLSWLAHPNVAYLLLTLGFYGILFELNSPGAILPGVAGAIFLILGFVALQTLPVNVAGLLLIVMALVFFLLEVKVQSHGILAAGGAISFLIGSLILFEPGLGGVFRVSLSVILGATLATVVFFLFVIAKAIGAQNKRVVSGNRAMVGEIGEALTRVGRGGQVRVRGEIWEATSSESIGEGSDVEVVAVRGLKLEVRARNQEGA